MMLRRMTASRLWIVLWSIAVVGCGGPTPPPPSVGTPPPSEQITGTERLGWDQRAADAVELATFRYAMYVDGNRSELTGVTCAAAQASALFTCSARVPAMS